MAHSNDPEMALFLQQLSADEVERLLVYLNGQTAFAKEQARLASDRAQLRDTPLAWAAAAQCEQYWRESWRDLQLLLNVAVLRVPAQALEN